MALYLKYQVDIHCAYRYIMCDYMINTMYINKAPNSLNLRPSRGGNGLVPLTASPSLQLFEMPKARQSTASQAPSLLRPNSILQIRAVSNNATTFLSSPYLEVSSSDLPQTLRGKLKFLREKTKQFSSRLSTALSGERTEKNGSDITARLLKANHRPRFNIDDAVKVLPNMSYSSNRGAM